MESEKITNFWEKSRIINVMDPITDKLAQDVISQLRYLDSISKDKPIEMHFLSPGGNADSGFAIIDYMTHMISSPIIGVCLGETSSMAAIMFLACDKRYMLPNSMLMLHGLQLGGLGGSFANVEKRMVLFNRIQANFINILKTRTKMKQAQIDDMLKTEAYYNAEEAIVLGLCDKIYTSKVK